MSKDLNDFIRSRIRADLDEGDLSDGIVTRFPPEPNGFLHIGHAKSICLNFGVTEEFGGSTYLRFDDTNPRKESENFVESIKSDVRWLGFDWKDKLTFASDYFDQLYSYAEQLINDGKAYVCSLTTDEIRNTRGTLLEPGSDSPYRDRSSEENLSLFRDMKAGKCEEGEHALRAKIDMSSPNMNMRDPVLYRVIHASHHRTGDEWCIYPMYDFTHCICDALEGITHSLCTLEFENHRPLYDWVLENIDINYHPPQIEFSRLGLEYAVMSKRVITELVNRGYVEGWDDPRLYTIAGLRRRGVPSESIRNFCRRIGISKQDNLVETEYLDFCVREELEQDAPRGMAVIDPLRVIITNFDEEDEVLTAAWHPKNPELGNRNLTFGREIYIERADFEEIPPKKYKRLSPGAIVRLRYAYIIRCDEVIKDGNGEVVEIRATYFPDSKSGADTSGLKPKGVIHFISAANSIAAEIRCYEHLFISKVPNGDRLENELNPESVRIYSGLIERALFESDVKRFQFERNGYFFRDESTSRLVFNRTVTLRDKWKPTT